MEIYLNLNDLPEFEKPVAAAIGNFDGVHIGHQHILKLLLEISQQYGYFSLVVTFYPHPGKLFNPENIQLIQTLNQRLDDISRFRIDKALVIPFDKNFADIPPRIFIKEVLSERLHADHVIVGTNFRFGKDRSGSVNTLKKQGAGFGICIHLISPVELDQEHVSSSLIRKYLNQGRLEKANRCLGKPYSIRGRIIKGRSRGRTLGFPTANLLPENEILPRGVFISRALLDGKKHPALTNIGICPTFTSPNQGNKNVNVESYLINIDSPLYGKHMTLELLKKIRNEKYFSSPEDLTSQIKKDRKKAMDYFSDYS